jgi:GH24 family phage-related lysozyme (muramidase)
MTSIDVEDFIEAEEGFDGKKLPDGSYQATYDEIGGCWNIGPGLTKGVTSTTVMTKAQIDAAFQTELLPVEDEVRRDVKVSTTRNQYIALVSFAYNVGTGGLRGSSIPGLVNSGQSSKVPDVLAQYVHGRATGAKVIPGLVNRRNAEIKLWDTPDSDASQGTSYVAHYDPVHPVPKGATTLEKAMTASTSTVNVPLQSTTAIVSQTGQKITAATQGFFLTLATYVLSHFSSVWDLLSVAALPAWACTLFIALIEVAKHFWISNSNSTTAVIINSLEAKLESMQSSNSN